MADGTDYGIEAIELHDSKVGEIVRGADGWVEVRFARAYVYANPAAPGTERMGGWQDCTMAIGNAVVDGEVGKLPSFIFTGELQVGENRHANFVPLPLRVEFEPAELVVFLAPDNRRVAVKGVGIEVRMHGEVELSEVLRW